MIKKETRLYFVRKHKQIELLLPLIYWSKW